MDKKQAKKEYIKIFNEKILPILRIEEVGRKRLFSKCTQLCKKNILIIILTTIFTIYLFKLITKDDNTSFNLLLVYYIVIGSCIYFCSDINIFKQINKIQEDFQKHLKESCMNKVLEAFGDICWSNEFGMTENDFADCGLFDLFLLKNSKIKTNDSFTGQYKNIRFRISECSLMLCDDLDIFNKTKQLMIILPLSKTIKSKIIVSTKFFSHRFKATRIFALIAMAPIILLLILIAPALLWGGNFLNVYDKEFLWFALCVSIFYALIGFVCYKNPNKGLQKAKLEDVVFNKRVNVDTQDQIEARCYLTPSFIDKFVNLKKIYNAKKVQCAFYDNKLMFVINTNKNLFEFGSVYKSLTKADTIKTLYDEINAIYDIIDNFRLSK